MIVSKAALDALRPEGSAALSSDYDIAPKRKWWLKWVLVLGVLCMLPSGCKYLKRAVTPATGFSGGTHEVPTTIREAELPRVNSEARPADQPGRAAVVVVEWVMPQSAGLRINGISYEVFPGDAIDGVSVGMLGSRYVDVSSSGQARRYFVPSQKGRREVASVRAGRAAGADEGAFPAGGSALLPSGGSEGRTVPMRSVNASR